jgi:hypothetical protein
MEKFSYPENGGSTLLRTTDTIYKNARHETASLHYYQKIIMYKAEAVERILWHFS